MSRATTYNFSCPCGEKFSSPIYDYVNVAKDPALRYTVMVGLLNVSTCPACGRRIAHSQPFIYSDPAHSLLAFVHPRSDVPEEARLLILDKLQTTYDTIVGDTEQDTGENNDGTANHTLSPESTLQIADTPPLHVIFGLDQLNEVINPLLSQDERMGRLALNTFSRNDAERGQLLHIARKLAREMQCQVEVEDLPDEYTVWLFGARRQIGAIMRELAIRG
ncbi:MAG TPA: CpXC domain-containing protein [Ktedonobacteraceae bacterium]|nr:CpXC domain-containing protein [Ktedonobacteraceae bacterium]